MSQILIHGRKGSGKTLLAVKLAYESFLEHRDVYSNIKLEFPHTPLTFDMIQTIMKQECLQNAFLLIDEIHTIADSRRSMSKQNVSWSYFFTQSRKRGVDIVATTQYVGQVDLRYRNNCEYLIKVEKIIIPTEDIAVRKFINSMTWYEPDGKVRCVKYLKNPEKYFKLYDTMEIIYYDWNFKKPIPVKEIKSKDVKGVD